MLSVSRIPSATRQDISFEIFLFAGLYGDSGWYNLREEIRPVALLPGRSNNATEPHIGEVQVEACLNIYPVCDLSLIRVGRVCHNALILRFSIQHCRKYNGMPL